jgi:hypothetical protein
MRVREVEVHADACVVSVFSVCYAYVYKCVHV